MLPLLCTALLLAQTPPAEVVEAANDVSLALGFVDRHLLSVESAQSGWSSMSVRQGSRTYRLLDDDRSMFDLVPEAMTLVGKADADKRIARGLMVAGLAADGGALALLVVSAIIGFSVPLLAVALGLALVGLIATCVGLPFELSSQRQFLEAITVYNHGLTATPGPAAPPRAVGLSVAF